MTGMFGTPIEHEESIRVQVAQRDGLQTIKDAPAETTDTEPVIPKVERPMIVTPEGTLVEPENSEVFAEDRQRLANEETRLMNLRDNLVATGGGARTEESEEEETPVGPTIPRVELGDDETYVDDTQRAMANSINVIAETIENQAKENQEAMKKVVGGIESVGKQTNEFVLENQLAQVEAVYDVQREELYAASRATGINDPLTLAQIVVGQKAQTVREDEARETAQAQLKADAGGIGGTSQGSPGGGAQPKREEVDYNDNEALAAAYKITQPAQY